jgi:chitodextrinase
LVAIEGLNSDGDTGTDDGIACSNITEINADTLPGDAGSTPTTCGANQPPIADAGGPYTGTAGQPVLFDGSGSSDTDGTVDQYDWDYGDGTLAPNAGPTPSHTYALPDDYTVSLTVTDNDGDTGSATTTASIAAAPEDPIANPGGPYEGTEGVELAFDGRASEDPDGGSITQYDWDFGDGNVGTGPEPSHTYATAGTYTVTLTVVDDEGVTSAPATTEAVIGSDQDGDGIADAQDNCILDANADQRDTDGDNYGNICDPDFNGDLVVNATDLAYMKVNFFGTDPDADLDGDGFVNAADLAILKNFFFQAPGPSGLVP